MNKTKITIEIDQDNLTGYTDEFLQTAWFLGQANQVDINDREAGEFAERIGREIIRRWLVSQQPPLWNHQGRHYAQGLLIKHGQWHKDGTEYRPHAHVFAENVARALAAISGMDPADTRIPKMLKSIRQEAEELVGPVEP